MRTVRDSVLKAYDLNVEPHAFETRSSRTPLVKRLGLTPSSEAARALGPSIEEALWNVGTLWAWYLPFLEGRRGDTFELPPLSALNAGTATRLG